MTDLIKLTGLWKNTSKAGKPYISGGLGYGAKLIIFPNEFKEKESDPDYTAYIAAKEQKEEKAIENDEIPF